MNEFEELKKRVIETDLSVNNLHIQKLYEKGVENWINDFVKPEFMDVVGKGLIKLRKMGPYGDSHLLEWKDVKVDGKEYPPSKVLQHVKARDEEGMNFLRIIDSYRQEDKHWNVIKKALPSSVEEIKNPDEVCMSCICGKHNVTHRQFLEGIVNGDPDSLFLGVGIIGAVAKFAYGDDRFKRFDEKTVEIYDIRTKNLEDLNIVQY